MDDPRLIPLSRGRQVLVDADDYDMLSKSKWYYNVSAGGYAARNVVGPDGHRSVQLMHRLINSTPHGFDTDHINHDRLDNRRSNLRTVTKQQNQRNRAEQPGISRERGKWAAYIKVNYRKIHLGRYKTLEEALSARLFGEAHYGV